MLNLKLQLIDTKDLTTIGFVDLTDYGNMIIKNPSFEVTAPGFVKTNVLFTPKQVNVFDAADLQVNCQGGNLPDGLYTVKYSVAPNLTNYVEKYFFNSRGLSYRFSNFVLKSLTGSLCGCTPNKVQRKLDEISLLINGVQAATNICDHNLASMLYNKASHILDNLNCDC